MAIKLNCPNTVNAGIDRATITFGTEGTGLRNREKRIEKLKMQQPAEISRGTYSSTFITLPYQHAKCHINIDSDRLNCNPHRLQANFSRMSDAELIDLRKSITMLFGKTGLSDIYLEGNITSMEFYIDQAHVQTGDILPVTKTGKWGMWGRDDAIETITYGNKLNKSYSKTSWFHDKHSPRLTYSESQNFIQPAFEMNRLELTRKFSKGKTDDQVRAATLVQNQGHDPFQTAAFIDMRLLSQNSHFNKIDTHCLTTLGRVGYLKLARESYPTAKHEVLAQLINSAERIGLDGKTASMLQDGIQRLQFLNPEFDVKRYKSSTPNLVMDYHHLGYVTRELLTALNILSRDVSHVAPQCKTLLKSWYNTTHIEKLAGQPLTRKRAIELLTLQEEYVAG